MKKILILCMAGILCLQTACGTKKEEEKKQEPTNNTQETPKVELTEEDYKKISSVMEISRKEEKTTLVKLTYKNDSTKDFQIKTIKLTARKGEQEILSKEAKINDTVAAGSEKTYSVELDAPIETLGQKDVTIDWEMNA